MPKRKKSVPRPPTKLESPAEAKRALSDIQAELEALSPDEVMSVNADVPRAVSVTLGAEPHIRAFEVQIGELPGNDLRSIRRLRVYALATLQAYLEAAPTTRRTDLAERITEATALKQSLLIAAAALVHEQHLDETQVAQVRQGSGHIDLASDLVALGALFEQTWAELSDKTAVRRAQVERASALGTELLTALGAKEHAATQDTSDAVDRRNRAFMLLVRAYDEARRAITYLRWKERDVDEFAPSLYARKLRRARADEAAEAEPEEGGDDPATGAEVAPTASPEVATLAVGTT